MMSWCDGHGEFLLNGIKSGVRELTEKGQVKNKVRQTDGTAIRRKIKKTRYGSINLAISNP